MLKNGSHSNDKLAYKRVYGCIRQTFWQNYEELFAFHIAYVNPYPDIFGTMLRWKLWLWFMGLVIQLGAQELPINDLQPYWRVYEDEHFRPYTPKDAGTKSVYLELSGKSGHLEVSSKQHPIIFVNGKLLMRCNERCVLSLDSLSNLAGAAVFRLAIFQKSVNPETLLTRMVMKSPSMEEKEKSDLPETYLRDFVFIAMLIMLVILIVLRKMNQKLTKDYFSFIKLFLGQESDEIQAKSGTGMSLLFYLYCCLILAFYILLIFQFTAATYSVAWSFQITSFSNGFLQWMKLWGLLLFAFFIKLCLIYVSCRSFRLDLFAFHMFNWTRLMLIGGGSVLMLLLVYFISRGQTEGVYHIAYLSLSWILVFWMIMLFPKVARRSNFSLFHLFSYLCATEVIPLLISIRVLFN